MSPSLRFALAACLSLVVAAICLSCSTEPVNIKYGIDQCARCELVIDDNRFGAALESVDGQTVTFNSIECLMGFHIKPSIPNEQFKSSWVSDYNKPGHLLRAGQAFFIHTQAQSSPGGIGLFAFATDSEAQSFLDQNDGEKVQWDGVKEIVKLAWFEEPPATPPDSVANE